VLPLCYCVVQDLVPPKHLFIEVRALENVGDIVTDNGSTINLEAGTTHNVRRSDVEHLIRRGSLEHIS
jgi:GINS complex subunit 1